MRSKRSSPRRHSTNMRRDSPTPGGSTDVRRYTGFYLENLRQRSCATRYARGISRSNRIDLFFPPTRGLRELVNSLRLRLAGVPTPEVVAVISYRAGPVLRRSDVATREIAESHDLSQCSARCLPAITAMHASRPRAASRSLWVAPVRIILISTRATCW